MPKLNCNGVDIYYEDQGSGPAILLGHGFSATSQMWRKQVETFKDRYRIITWDMRGHGKSDYPEDQALYSEDHTVADMAALLDHCGIDQAIVGGLSLGGYATLSFYLKYPERCLALMLFDTGPGFKQDAARDGWNKFALNHADELESKGLSGMMNSPETQVSQHRDANGLAKAARGMLTQRDARAINSLPEIKLPTLVLVGELDDGFLAATDYMAAKIPRSTKAIIGKAGHAANIDNPEEFNQAVASFLDSLTA